MTNVNTCASFEYTHEGRAHIGASRIGDSGPSGAIAFANVMLKAGSTYATRWVRNSPDPDNRHILQEWQSLTPQGVSYFIFHIKYKDIFIN